MHRENDLNELVKRLKQAALSSLTAAVLYGSAAGDGYQEEHSDLNTLCVLERLDGETLAKLQPVGLWWWRKGHPAPLVFTLEELRRSADIFAIELLDMKQRHRMLLGEDFFGGLDVPMTLHRLQVERELRTNVIRLRQAFLRSRGRGRELAELMIASASTFGVLFRHSLIALGKPGADSPRDAGGELAALLGFDASAFYAVLDLREGKKPAGDHDDRRVFAAYLDAVTRVAEEMDRLLAAK